MLDLTQGSVLKRTLQFASPFFIGNLFQQIYSIVDAVIVGKFVGGTALTAVVNATQIIICLLAMLIGLVSGGTVVVAQYFGQKNTKKMQDASDTLHLFFFIASLIITFLGLFFVEQLVDLIKVPAEAREYTITYLQIMFIGLCGMFGYNASSSILRGIGDSSTPLYAIIIASILNVGLDLLFVLKFHWNVFGVGLATVLSQFAAWMFIMYYVNHREHLLKLRILYLKFDKKIFWQSLRIGFPTGAQQLFAMLGMTALMGMINDMGVQVSAGFGMAIRLETFIFLPAITFSVAISTFTGQNIGAGNVGRVREGLLVTLILSNIITLLVGLIFFLFPVQILSLLMNNDDIEAIAIGASYFSIIGLFYPVANSLFIFNGLHRGAGATFIPTLITFFSLWVVRTPLALFFVNSNSRFFADNQHYLGVFWSIPVAWALGLIAFFIYHKTGKWKNYRVIAPIESPL